MKKTVIITIIISLLSLGLAPVVIGAQATPDSSDKAVRPDKPDKSEKCPVCGMFVYKYPDWIAAARLKNMDTLYFDGAKDLFKFLLSNSDKVVRAWVTEYYGLTLIDARSAFYVMGSDVYGPMGHELVPFASKAEAEEFMTDHKGKRLLRFEDINTVLLEGLK